MSQTERRPADNQILAARLRVKALGRLGKDPEPWILAMAKLPLSFEAHPPAV